MGKSCPGKGGNPLPSHPPRVREMIGMDFGSIPKYDPYVKVELHILGKKEVKSPKNGKTYTLLVCEDSRGREVSLFDWALDQRGTDWFVLKKHLTRALDTAK